MLRPNIRAPGGRPPADRRSLNAFSVPLILKPHYRAFLSLLRNAESWEMARKTYSKINTPVLLLWGDRDWSRPDEREHDRQIVPGAEMATVENGGHFLPLDRPDAVIEALLTFQG